MTGIIVKFLLSLLISIIFSVKSHAGPPPNTKTIMMPVKMMCSPNFSDMIASLTTDFAVHIATTFQMNETLKVVIVENPNTGTVGVLTLSPNATCVVFSGQFMLKFERPPNMAPPALNMDGTPYQEIML